MRSMLCGQDRLWGRYQYAGAGQAEGDKGHEESAGSYGQISEVRMPHRRMHLKPLQQGPTHDSPNNGLSKPASTCPATERAINS